MKKCLLFIFLMLGLSSVAYSKPDPNVIRLYYQNLYDNESGKCYEQVAKFEASYYILQSGGDLKEHNFLTDKQFKKLAKKWSINLEQELIGNEYIAIYLAEHNTRGAYAYCLGK